MQVHPTRFGAANDKTRVLFRPGRFYEITNYQRPYTWTTPQYDNLLDDIQYSVTNPKETIPWPNVLLQRAHSDDPEIEVFDIGDGQQRLTTVYLCLLAIWHLAVEKTDNLEVRPAWVYELMPVIDENETEGILGAVTINGGTKRIRPRIAFHADESQQELEQLLKLFTIEREVSFQKMLKTHVREIKLGEAFFHFKDFFSTADVDILEHSKNVVLKRILLSTYLFESNEDMYRAFGKMNSGGVPLTEGQLIKADVYGKIQRVDPELADTIARIWTNHYETEFWNASGKDSRSNLERALECFQDIEGVPAYDSAGDLIAQYSSPMPWAYGEKWWNNRRKTIFWNRKQQIKLLDSYIDSNDKDIEVWWESLQNTVKWYKIAYATTVENEDYSPGSVQWEFRYTVNLIGVKSINPLLRMRKILDDDELIKALRLVRKYAIAIGVGDVNSYLKVQHLLVSPESPLLKPTFTADELHIYLLSKKDKGCWTKDISTMASNLAKLSVQGNAAGNAFVTRLFCFVSNEKKLQDGNLDSVSDWFAPANIQKRSREHILPQTPRLSDQMTKEERAIYDAAVKTLGNNLILNTTSNSSANNKGLEDKLSEYSKASSSNEGWFWINNFFEYLTEIGGAQNFNIAAVEERSERLAIFMAPYLVSPPMNISN